MRPLSPYIILKAESVPNVMISACAKGKHSERSPDIFDAMQRQWQAALRLLVGMSQSALTPDE